MNYRFKPLTIKIVESMQVWCLCKECICLEFSLKKVQLNIFFIEDPTKFQRYRNATKKVVGKNLFCATFKFDCTVWTLDYSRLHLFIPCHYLNIHLSLVEFFFFSTDYLHSRCPILWRWNKRQKNTQDLNFNCDKQIILMFLCWKKHSVFI